MVISLVYNSNFVMNEIRENNGYGDKDRIPKWTNLTCPSCFIYYGVQSLIRGIKKQRQRTATIQNK
jgi:hypothetical protein